MYVYMMCGVCDVANCYVLCVCFVIICYVV